MGVVNRFAAWLMGLVVILLPFFVILSAVSVFCTEQFVRYEYSLPSFPPSQRFSAQDRYYNSVQTVRYVRGAISVTELRNLGVYNEREIKHLVDVRNVWNMVMTFHTIAGPVILVALVLLAAFSLTRLWAARAIFYGGVFSIVVILLIGIFSVVNFDQFFILFHHIFFEGDTWLFNYTDSLIQFYPEPFWEAASYGIALFVGIASLLLTMIGLWWQRTEYRLAAKASQRASARI